MQRPHAYDKLDLTSDLIYYGLLAAAVAAPALRREPDRRARALRTLQALGLSMAAAQVLKRVVRAPRPDDGEPESFPSSHAANSFAAAAVSEANPASAPAWYAVAAIVGLSRPHANEHRPHEVAAGAALGVLAARFVLSRPRERRAR